MPPNFAQFIRRPDSAPAPVVPEMSSDDMRADLENKLAVVESMNNEAIGTRKASQDKVRSVNIEIVKSVFQMMKEAGVDPGDISSVSAFTSQLEAQNPDLVTMFEQALASLTESDQQKAISATRKQGGGIDTNNLPPSTKTPPASPQPDMQKKVQDWRKRLMK